MKPLKFILTSIAFLTGLYVLTQSARAVPSFARKYGTSCMTCQVAPPKLNAAGKAFLNRGYRMKDETAELLKQQEAFSLRSRGFRAPRLLNEGHRGDEPEFSEGIEFIPNATDFHRTGFKFGASLRDLNLVGDWQRNHDGIPVTSAIYQSDIYTAEANYVTPWAWLQQELRFEHVSPDWSTSFNRITPSLTMLLQANVIPEVGGAINSTDAPDLPPITTDSGPGCGSASEQHFSLKGLNNA